MWTISDNPHDTERSTNRDVPIHFRLSIAILYECIITDVDVAVT